LKVEHLDGQGGYLHVVDGKGGKQRTSYSPEARPRGSKRPFERPGLQEIRPGNVRQRKRITPHLLRHSFSRWTLDAGIDVFYLQQQLGHSSLSTTAVYLEARPNTAGRHMKMLALIGYSPPVDHPLFAYDSQMKVL